MRLLLINMPYEKSKYYSRSSYFSGLFVPISRCSGHSRYPPPGSQGGTDRDRYIINKNKNNNCAQLRLQVSDDKAWNIYNDSSLRWTYSTSSDFSNLGTTHMKLDNNGHLFIYNNSSNYLRMGHGGSNGFLDLNGKGNLDFRYSNNDLMTLTQSGDLCLYSGFLYLYNISDDNSSDNYLRMGHGGSNGFLDLNGKGNLDFRYNNNGLMRLTRSGSLGIGTTDPGTYKLAVNGSIKAQGIDVTAEGWPDFVFENDYDLKPLAEVEQFILQNKHLPDVPSEDEVLKNGINLAKMDALLLQKVEELTLYVIELRKENEELRTMIQP